MKIAAAAIEHGLGVCATARRRTLRPDPRPAADLAPDPVQMGSADRRRRRRLACYTSGAAPKGSSDSSLPAGRVRCVRACTARMSSGATSCPPTMSWHSGWFTFGSCPPRKQPVAAHQWARHYEFGATLARLNGPIAQLGERLAGSQRSSVRARLGPPEKPPRGGFVRSLASSSGMTPRSSARGISRSSINESLFRHQLRSARRVSPSDTTRQEGVRQAGAFH